MITMEFNFIVWTIEKGDYQCTIECNKEENKYKVKLYEDFNRDSFTEGESPLSYSDAFMQLLNNNPTGINERLKEVNYSSSKCWSNYAIVRKYIQQQEDTYTYY